MVVAELTAYLLACSTCYQAEGLPQLTSCFANCMQQRLFTLVYRGKGVPLADSCHPITDFVSILCRVQLCQSTGSVV